MDRPSAPAHVDAIARERAAARARRDWQRADELKARIEDAGWHVVDAGMDYELAPAAPPDEVIEGITHYGAPESVPSRLDEPATRAVSVILVAEARPPSPGPSVAALSTTIPPDTEVVVVTPRGAIPQGPVDQVIRTATAFSAGASLAAGLRRASGAVVVVLDPRRPPTADIVTPLLAALADASVAMAGSAGLRSRDLHRYEPAGAGDVTTLGSGAYAFRRDEAIERGPVDARLHLPGSVAAWLGLLLRDEGPDRPPRRALALDLPLGVPDEGLPLPDDHARHARRDNYRIVERFRGRPWLMADSPPEGRLVGDGAHGHDEEDEAPQQEHASPA